MMNRRIKRELIARTVTILVVVIPVSLGAIAGILLYTFLGWEGRALGVGAIGLAFTSGFGAMSGSVWSEYADVANYPHVYKDRRSWLRDWIEEPEEKPKKAKPKEGAWKEE